MQKTDRFTKIVLAIIAIGIFGLILKPLFQIPSAEAQSSKQYVSIGYNKNPYFSKDAEVAIGEFESTGPIGPLLETVNHKGWGLHSVVFIPGSGYLVIAEK